MKVDDNVFYGIMWDHHMERWWWYSELLGSLEDNYPELEYRIKYNTVFLDEMSYHQKCADHYRTYTSDRWN